MLVHAVPIALTAAAWVALAAVAHGSAEEALRLGRWSEAETAALAALDRSPESAADWARLGRARLGLEKYAGAEQALRRAVELGRTDPTTLLALGAAAWENGDPDAAEAAYRRALEVTGRSPAVLHALGRLLAWRGRAGEAVALFAEARASGADDALLLVDLARAIDAAGRRAEAIVAYREALRLAPEHAEARYRLGLLLARAGDAAGSARELARYRELAAAQQEQLRAEGLEAARLERARAETAGGRPAVALQLLAGMPETPDVLLAMARALVAAGDAPAAVDVLQRAVILAPGREDLLRQLAAARAAAGSW